MGLLGVTVDRGCGAASRRGSARLETSPCKDMGAVSGQGQPQILQGL